MLKPFSPEDLDETVSELRKLRSEKEQMVQKIEKLKKINQVLMRRVELGEFRVRCGDTCTTRNASPES